MRTKTLLAFVALSFSLAVSGCSNSGNSGNDGSATVGESGNASTDNQDTRSNSIVVGIQQDLDSLDPHLAEAAGTDEVLFNVFEGLVKPDSEGNLVGAVAESYKISEDGKVYTFTLRDGVKFHNGDTVTAEDVKYSLDRCAGKLESAPGEILYSSYKAIDEVVITDEKTVEVRLVEGDTEFIAYMTAAIIPDDYENQATKPVGTGPFEFVSYTPQDSFVVKRFDDYYGDKAYLEQVTFKIIADADSSVLLALQAGTIDIYPYLTADQAAEMTDDYTVEVATTNLIQALFLNNAEKPFDDVRVRQALCYLVSAQDIMDMVGGGYGNEIGSAVFPAFGKYFDEDLVGYYETNAQKAKELLADAGYPDGFDMTITVPSNYQFHMDTAQVIVEQLKAGGINATINPVEWPTWLEEVYSNRQFQSTIVGLDAVLAPKALLSRYESTSNKNFINFASEDYDEAIRKAMASISDEEKIALYTECQEILTKEAASVFIQDPASLVAVSKKLGGYTFYPVYVQDMSKVYFK